MAMPSKKGRKMVSRHIKLHKREGMPQERAVAAALSEARRKGYKVSPRRRKRKATRKSTRKSTRKTKRKGRG
jgi:hypothetical protein